MKILQTLRAERPGGRAKLLLYDDGGWLSFRIPGMDGPKEKHLTRYRTGSLTEEGIAALKAEFLRGDWDFLWEDDDEKNRDSTGTPT